MREILKLCAVFAVGFLIFSSAVPKETTSYNTEDEWRTVCGDKNERNEKRYALLEAADTAPSKQGSARLGVETLQGHIKMFFYCYRKEDGSMCKSTFPPSALLVKPEDVAPEEQGVKLVTTSGKESGTAVITVFSHQFNSSDLEPKTVKLKALKRWQPWPLDPVYHDAFSLRLWFNAHNTQNPHWELKYYDQKDWSWKPLKSTMIFSETLGISKLDLHNTDLKECGRDENGNIICKLASGQCFVASPIK